MPPKNNAPVNEDNAPRYAFVGGVYVEVAPGAPIPTAAPTPAAPVADEPKEV